MNTHERIEKVLDKVPFGLTAEEIAAKTGTTTRGVSNILGDMVKKRKIVETKAGKTYFYRVALLIILLLPVASAQNFSSTTYLMTAMVLDSTGGNNTAINYTLQLSMGQVSGRKSSENYELCAGFICNFYDAVNRGRVSFMLAFNISGNMDDQIFVDNYREPGTYNPEELLNYYVCIQNSNLPGGPTFGLIHSGSVLGYVRAAPANTYTLKISEDLPGNRFIIPVTSGNCSVINPRLQQITQYGTILQPFVIFTETINAVELALSYDAFQIAGSFDKTGQFKLIIEKNLTNDKQIIIRPE